MPPKCSGSPRRGGCLEGGEGLLAAADLPVCGAGVLLLRGAFLAGGEVLLAAEDLPAFWRLSLQDAGALLGSSSPSVTLRFR